MKKQKKSKGLFKNPVVKNILLALVVAVFGFILLNLTFILDAVYQGGVRWIIGHFISLGSDSQIYWFPPLMHGSFVILIGLISWFVFKSKLKKIYKAIYMPVPVAVVLATIGIFLYSWPILVYSLCILLCLGTLYYFYRTKQPWIYYYAMVLVGLILAIFTLLGGEI